MAFYIFPLLPPSNFLSDIDECESVELNNCNASTETCENTEGGYICSCRLGHKKDDGHCVGMAYIYKLLKDNILIKSQKLDEKKDIHRI